MTAISAYTEPVTVDTSVNINELPQPNEDEEINESSEFAQLLAGLLQNTGKTQTDIAPVDLSEGEINVEAISSTDELIGRQEKLNLFENVDEAANVNDAPDVEISENHLFEDHFNALAAVENLLNSSVKAEVSGDEHFQHEAAGITGVNNLRETKIAENVSMTDFPETVSVTASAAVDGELHSETEYQEMPLFLEKAAEDRLLSKNDNVESLLTAQKPDTEKKPENENRSRLDEMRGRSRRDRVTLEVNDLRTETGASKTQSHSVIEAAAKRSGAEAPVREITLELRLPYDYNGSAVTQGQTIWETRSGNNGSVNMAFENLLARELHQNFNGDIVRHASMALRDGGEGTIKIALKPESLGNVKIHLEMTDNRITGQIVVESEEALNAFRKEVASLEQAFRDSGFTNADLNLSLTSNGQNSQGWEKDASSFTPMTAALRYDDSSFYGDEHDASLADILIGRKGSIDMLA